jgi:hypothetical protein
MSDGAFLVLAAFVAGLFVVGVLLTNPERRNPHVNARPRWHTRRPK